MAKKPCVLLARGKQPKRKRRPTSSSDIDFSDIPESTDEELRRAKRVGMHEKPSRKKECL